MRILPQFTMFDQTQNEEVLGDLERLERVLANIPDGKLIYKLNEIRGKGRNDWPVISMWNAMIAGIVFQHPKDSALLRELNRNSQLRDMCGFEPRTEKQEDGTDKILVAPSPSAYSRFIKNLKDYCKEELVYANLKVGHHNN